MKIRNRYLYLIFSLIVFYTIFNFGHISLGESDFTFPKGTTIRLICPYSPGGGFDAVSRLASPFIQEYLNKIGGIDIKVIVVNVTGGGGSIATTQVYKEKADGTTILHIDPETSVWQQALQNTNFDVTKFIYIAQQSSEPAALTIRSDLKIDSIDDLIKKSKEKSLLMGTSGRNGIDHIGTILFQLFLQDKNININFDYLHMPGVGDVIASMRRKEADGIIVNYSSLLGANKEGFAKMLFIFNSKRLTDVPDIKVLPEVLKANETEYNELIDSFARRRMWAVPPETPKKITNILVEAFRLSFSDKRYLDMADKMKRPMAYKSGNEAYNIIKNEWAVASRYRDKIKEIADK